MSIPMLCFPAVQIITVKEMFEGATIRVPAMLDTAAPAAIGRKKAALSAFGNPRDLNQREMMLPIEGGRLEGDDQASADAPVMPSFRARRADG